MLPPSQHLERFGIGRRAHLRGQDEAVQLRLRQRIRAMKLGRVLSRDDKERPLEDARRAFDRDLAFTHGFEERGLGARRGPVDLVGQDDVREDRSGHELESQLLLVEDARAGDVGGKKVRRALDAAKCAADRGRKGAGEHRLARAGKVLEQDVPAGDQPSERQAHHAVLAHDDAVDVLLDAVEQLGGAARLERSFLHLAVQSRAGIRRLRRLSPGRPSAR